jgi:hypothetical protein
MSSALQRLVLLAIGAGVLPFVLGWLRLARPAAGTPRWPPVASILLCALAFNLTFIWQELWLVIPKALTPGLSPILYHNDHGWTGTSPVTDLLQATGALATLCSGLASLAALRAWRGASASTRLLLFWLAFQGLFQSLTQLAIGTLLPGNDVGRALAWLGASIAAKSVLCAASVAAMLAAGRSLAAHAPAGLAAARAVGTRAFASALLATAAGCVVLSVPLREPRDWIEVALVPAIVDGIGVGWLVLGSAIAPVHERADVRIGVIRPLLALVSLLLLFQLVLRHGIRF